MVRNMDNIHSDLKFADQPYVFHDRIHAGVVLADMLKDVCDPDTLVLAIPAGGVPVAVEIAARCGLAMDIIPVSKILLPWTTESGFGAVAFDGTCWIDDRLVERFGLDETSIRTALSDAENKVRRRLQRYRGNKPFPVLSGKTVILVDDGIAAGSTVRAGLLALEKLQAGKIIIATPTARDSSLREIAQMTAEVYCPNIRCGHHFSVAEAYENWSDVSDRELDDLLNIK
jgi:putative phosphoribosyl transferase